jgi:putative transposase
MPRKQKAAATVVKELPSIPKELIDEFVKGPMSAEAIQSASMAFKKALIERALGAELWAITSVIRRAQNGPRTPPITATARAARRC